MKKVYSMFKHYTGSAILSPLCKLIEALLELLIPLIVAKIVDIGIPNGDSGYIVRMILFMGGLGILGLGFSLLGQFFSAKAATGYAASLRSGLYKKTINMPFAETDRQGIPTLITRLTSDCNQVQTGVNMVLRLLLRSPFVVFGAFAMAAIINLQLSLIVLAAIVVLFAIILAISLSSLPKYRKNQITLDSVAEATRENLVGVRVIRAFGAEDRFEDDFKEKTERLYKGQIIVARISSLLNPFTYFIVNLAIVLILYFGGVKVYGGSLSQGEVIALYQYILQILVELIKLANLIILMPKSAASLKRLSEILENDSAYEVKADGQTDISDSSVLNNNAEGESENFADSHIIFDHVSMKYFKNGEYALSDFSLKIKKGEKIGIIGGTGSGKSTLVSLMPRFYDVTDGTLIIDGKDVQTYDVEELRNKFGFVLQKAELFEGTVRENMQIGNVKASDEEIVQALKDSQAMEVIEKKEGGLDYEVEQHGANFSGGQKQRLAIARALVRKPEILVLDDSSSALDYATEAKLRKAINKLPYKPTVFVVSQRIGMIRRLDKIVVLDEGKTVGIGTHEELLKNCDLYRQICKLQGYGGGDNA
ncbi:MAG: ABC transporter ATP-binding protein [Christensenellales bacterium]